MATRFVHVGDCHLQAGHPRNADRLASLDQIIGAGLALGAQLGAWLVPGDLFHSRSTVADRNDLAGRLTRMAEAAPVVIVRGNHDQIGDLDIFARLKATWPVYLSTRPEVVRLPLPTGEAAAIACIPYPDKYGLVSAGVAPGDVSAAAGALLDAIVMQLAEDLAEPIRQGAIPLAAAHLNVAGAIASTGQPQIGQELELDRAMLARLPVVYVALNHIHKAQAVGAGVFAGSIAAMDHGETEPKSFVVVTVDLTDTGWSGTWQRQSLVTPPLFHVEGRLTRAGFTLDADARDEAEIHRRVQEGDWAGCDVRVRYRYAVSEYAALDEAALRALFAGALRLKVEAIAQPDRELRLPAVAAATTLADKLVAYAASAGLGASAGVLDKLARLEHTDPATLLADITHGLATVEAGEVRETAAEVTSVTPDATFDPAARVAHDLLSTVR